MNKEDENPSTTDPIQCERCGKPGAVKFGDHIICEECYGVCGSCCMEFGGDDLWKPIEKKKTYP